MCEHENKRIIKTTGTNYLYKCFDCGKVWLEEKYPKKSILDKIKEVLK